MIELIHKIKRKLIKLRLQPIRVFCFHQVSDVFEPDTMWECDWMQIEQFKRNIMHLKEQYTFISLPEAYHKLTHDKIRCKKIAVLTADDGWASVMNIIPWLAEQNIPITLFLNPLYLDGVHKQERETEKLITARDLHELLVKYPNVLICSHGWTHVDTLKIDQSEFESLVIKSEKALAVYVRKEPFYAFSYGHYKKEYLCILEHNNLVPVLMDGKKNYKYDGVIHREELK